MTPSPRLPAWRAALRMAWRSTWRAKKRSALVVALIGLPVLALATADVTYRTYQLSPIVKYQRANGAASVELTAEGQRVRQNADGTSWESAPGRLNPAWPKAIGSSSTATIASLLGPGTRVLERTVNLTATVRTRAGLATTEFVGVDYSDPVAAGLAHQDRGRAPRTSGEVAITADLAGQADLRVGSVLRTEHPTRHLTVVGIVSDPSVEHISEAFLFPAPGDGGSIDFLARTVHPVSWAEVQALDARGFLVQSRYVTAHPPPASEVPFVPGAPSGARTTEVVSGALLAGLALLEVILLAGPAFAVMARRQERSLALVASVGGTRRDLRNTVLAYGVVLGAAAGVLATVLAVGVAAVTVPIVARFAHHRPGAFTARPIELGAILLVSLVTALAAAVMPARAAAATDVVAALAGRRPRRPARLRVPVIAVLIGGLGVLVALAGAKRSSSSTVPILAGVSLVEIGLIIATPTVLLVVTGVGRHLPLAARLALRDAGRNRSSAAPAVAAVMAAVIGCVAVLLGVATQSAMEKRIYEPFGLHGEVRVGVYPPGAASAIASAVRSTMPVSKLTVLSQPGRACTGSCTTLEVAPHLPAGQTRRTRYAQNGDGPAIVAGASAIPILTSLAAPAAQAALRAGRAVVLDAWAVHDGRAALDVVTYPANGGAAKTRTIEVPAVALTRGFAPTQVILPPALAERMGVGASPSYVLAATRTSPTASQQQALQAALVNVSLAHPTSENTVMSFEIEKGYHDRFKLPSLLLVLAASIVALGAAGTATALSNADRAEDFLTLDAIGASPRTRRIVSLARAGLIAIIGVVLGTVAGFVPVIAWITSVNRAQPPTVPATDGLGSSNAGTLLSSQASSIRHLVIPWPHLAALIVGLPVLSALLAGGLSRSHLGSNPRGVRAGRRPAYR